MSSPCYSLPKPVKTTTCLVCKACLLGSHECHNSNFSIQWEGPYRYHLSIWGGMCSKASKVYKPIPDHPVFPLLAGTWLAFQHSQGTSKGRMTCRSHRSHSPPTDCSLDGLWGCSLSEKGCCKDKAKCILINDVPKKTKTILDQGMLTFHHKSMSPGCKRQMTLWVECMATLSRQQ